MRRCIASLCILIAIGSCVGDNDPTGGLCETTDDCTRGLNAFYGAECVEGKCVCPAGQGLWCVKGGGPCQFWCHPCEECAPGAIGCPIEQPPAPDCLSDTDCTAPSPCTYATCESGVCVTHNMPD